MVNMRSKILYFSVFLVFLLLGSGLLAQPSLDFCPIEPGEESIQAPIPEVRTLPSAREYTVPRRQIVVEIATATW